MPLAGWKSHVIHSFGINSHKSIWSYETRRACNWRLYRRTIASTTLQPNLRACLWKDSREIVTVQGPRKRSLFLPPSYMWISNVLGACGRYFVTSYLVSRYILLFVTYTVWLQGFIQSAVRRFGKQGDENCLLWVLAASQESAMGTGAMLPVLIFEWNHEMWDV